MNKGTTEGTEEEINFIKRLNKDKSDRVWNIILPGTPSENLFAVHVKGHKLIKPLEISVNSKSDVYIAECSVPENYLSNNDFYLSEDECKRYITKFVPGSGISVKRRDSSRYQISKISPSTFSKIFGSCELGAGSSIYCQKSDELGKNIHLLSGWNTDIKKFSDYFNDIGNVGILFDSSSPTVERLLIARKIKTYSTNKIKSMILENRQIYNYVFTGVGFFEEPYCAHWIYEKDNFRKISDSPFVVTTGSGRSKGDYTVVIKPE